ncbi:PAS domain S-box protein [Pseudomonas entomophila]|uniref:sensor domain-containing diguanylate cyclase n=1 Tax=Pseudomonas sp. RIT-PI-S TaxID=3035295 RepID=UPI0021D88011
MIDLASEPEQIRLRLLRALNLLDTEPEPEFDRITRLLARALNVPIALVSLIDEHRQWFKSAVGLDVRETPREIAFCDHAIRQREPLVVNDATQDLRFANNPLVRSAPNIRFYAGYPLRTSDGYALGTLCAIDSRPRELSPDQRQILTDLAELVVREVRLREASLLSRSHLEISEARIETAEDRFRSVFESAGPGMAVSDALGGLVRINPAFADLVGYSREELVGMSYSDLTHPDDLSGDLEQWERLCRGEIDRFELEKRCVRKDGEIRWVHLTLTRHNLNNGALDFILAVVTDIQARKAAQGALAQLANELEQRVAERTHTLHQREAELSAVLEYTQDAYVRTDEQGRILSWNRQAEATFGWSRDEAVGQLLEELLIPPELRERHTQGMRRYLRTGENRVLGRRLELQALRRDGQTIPVEVHINALHVEQGVFFNAFLHEITARKAKEEARERQALQDPLTGVANRRALNEWLPRAMGGVAAEAYTLSVLFIDLDGFKAVNDNLGHDAGDVLLKEIGQRMVRCLRGSDRVFRLAGDEFVVVLAHLADPTLASGVARKLLSAIASPVMLGERSVEVSASIGLTLHEVGDPRSAEQLIKDADSAMYAAKQGGRNRVCLFERTL